MGVGLSKASKVYIFTTRAEDDAASALETRTDGNEELDNALSAFKSKMGTKAVDSAVNKMLPSLYIRGAIVGASDITLAKETWKLVSIDENPEFKRRKDTQGFMFASSLRWYFETFYGEFARIDPSSKAIFKDETGMSNAMSGMINMILISFDQGVTTADAVMTELAVEHSKYGVRAKHYRFMCDSFFVAMKTCLGDAGFNKKRRCAWNKIWSCVLRNVLKAALTEEINMTKEDNRQFAKRREQMGAVMSKMAEERMRLREQLRSPVYSKNNSSICGEQQEAAMELGSNMGSGKVHLFSGLSSNGQEQELESSPNNVTAGAGCRRITPAVARSSSVRRSEAYSDASSAVVDLNEQENTSSKRVRTKPAGASAVASATPPLPSSGGCPYHKVEQGDTERTTAISTSVVNDRKDLLRVGSGLKSGTMKNSPTPSVRKALLGETTTTCTTVRTNGSHGSLTQKQASWAERQTNSNAAAAAGAHPANGAAAAAAECPFSAGGGGGASVTQKETGQLAEEEGGGGGGGGGGGCPIPAAQRSNSSSRLRLNMLRANSAEVSFVSKMRESFNWHQPNSLTRGGGGGKASNGDVDKLDQQVQHASQESFQETMKRALADIAKRMLPASVLARQLQPPFYIHDAQMTPEIIQSAKNMWNMVINNTAPEYLKIKEMETFEHKSCLSWFFDTFFGKFAAFDSSTQILYRGNLKIKAKALIGIVNIIVASARASKKERDRILNALAYEHAKYGVSSTQYTSMSQSFVATMGEVLGAEGWTKEAEHTWAVVWSVVLQSVVPAAITGERSLTNEQKEFIGENAASLSNRMRGSSFNSNSSFHSAASSDSLKPGSAPN